MHELDPDQERFAGLVDGMRAGFADAVTAARREIARFGLEIDSKLQVRQAQGRVSLAPEPQVIPDNPHDDAGYREGWELGRTIGNRDGRVRVRQSLVSFGLFLATDDTVTTVEVASALVAMARSHDRQQSLELLQDDKALHAFLDAVQSPGTAPARGALVEPPQRDTVQEPAPASHSRPPGRFRRGLMMVKENVNRRTAIAALLGALSAGWFGLTTKSTPEGSNTGTASEGALSTQSGYVPPTTWDNLPQAYRDQMLSWDQVAWTLEQAQSPSPVIATIVTAVMTQPTTMDHYKRQVAHFLRSSQRDSYWGELTLGLNQQSTGVTARISLLSSMLYRIESCGSTCIPQSVYQTLLQLFQGGLETDTDILSLVDSILTAGGIPH